MGEWEVTAPPNESISVLRVVGEQTDTAGKFIGYIQDSPPRYDGEVLTDEACVEDGKRLPHGNISPVIIKLYEQDDPHVRSWLRKRGTGGKTPAEPAEAPEGITERLAKRPNLIEEQRERTARVKSGAGASGGDQ